jgi:hypothetical protein
MVDRPPCRIGALWNEVKTDTPHWCVLTVEQVKGLVDRLALFDGLRQYAIGGTPCALKSRVRQLKRSDSIAKVAAEAGDEERECRQVKSHGIVWKLLFEGGQGVRTSSGTASKRRRRGTKGLHDEVRRRRVINKVQGSASLPMERRDSFRIGGAARVGRACQEVVDQIQQHGQVLQKRPSRRLIRRELSIALA